VGAVSVADEILVAGFAALRVDRLRMRIWKPPLK
jgi:hypothetical protein